MPRSRALLPADPPPVLEFTVNTQAAPVDVRALLETHLAFYRAATPAEYAFALDVEGLLDPAVTFFSYRVDGRLLAIGALKQLSDSEAELKSMHTAVDARGQGIGRAMLEHLIALARTRGYRLLNLETGSQPAFAPAHALYRRAGFVERGPFGDYPAIGAVVAHQLGFRGSLPPYFSIPRNPSFTWELGKSAFLGGRFESFKTGDPNTSGFRVPDVNPPENAGGQHQARRESLLNAVDGLAKKVEGNDQLSID